ARVVRGADDHHQRSTRRDAAESALCSDAGWTECAGWQSGLHRSQQRRLLAGRRASDARKDVAMGRAAARDRREPLGRLVRFEATDGVPLSGMLFEPRRPLGALLWLHGTGGASVFESARTNQLARVFEEHRLAFFPFN